MKYKLNYIPDSLPVMYELYKNRIMVKAAGFFRIAMSGKGRNLCFEPTALVGGGTVVDVGNDVYRHEEIHVDTEKNRRIMMYRQGIIGDPPSTPV